MDKVLPFTDYILYDIKLFDSIEHKKYTGVPNERILENLIYVSNYIRKSGRRIELWIRTPLIPGITAVTDNVRLIGCFIKTHLSDVLTRWELCAFNGVCVSKYEKLDIKWCFDGQGAMTEDDITPLRHIAESLVPAEKVLVTGMIRSGI